MKTCLVGCGGIAAVHGSVLTSGIDTEFVAAADIKPEKAQSYAENFHTKPYPSLESMLDAEKPDVLHICTPHYLHVPMTIYALERNINVFMEKPPAISFDQLEELKKLLQNLRHSSASVIRTAITPASALQRIWSTPAKPEKSSAHARS